MKMVQIRDLCLRVTSGGTPSRSHPEYFSPGASGHLWLKSKELQDGVIADTEEKITDDGLKNSSAKYLPAHTVLIAMYGANVGQLGWLRRLATVNQAICGLVINPEKADFRYIFYALLETRGGLIAQAQGAAQQNLNQDKIKDYAIPVPALDEQRRIATILSVYDDLIEKNTRRIAILEEMARRIYEEWFVRFRFPGHENVRMVESELGLVPEGWDVVRLDQVLVLQRGFDLPTKARSEGPYPVIAATGEHGTHFESRVKGPGVVTGRSGSLGTVLYIQNDFWPLNTTLWVKRYVVGSPLYAFFVLRTIDLAGFNSGAAVPTLNRNDIHGLPVVRPGADVLHCFDEVVEPMMRLTRTLTLKNQNLRTTRDFLLPKLISGELDVSELPEPESAAA
jgi:type I restriction enzyme, S subunit